MRSRLAAALAFAGAFAAAPSASAESIIKNPGDHPDYHVEIEPQVAFGWTHYYASSNGLGAGVRFSIPLVDNGFIKEINNNVAIGFGLDYLHYDGCYYRVNGVDYGCGAGYLTFPVVMQWNFFLTEHWSVFGEPGLFIYHGFFDTNYCDARFKNCGYATANGVDLAFFAGGRYHFNDKISITMRIGYPTFSFGVSFFL